MAIDGASAQMAPADGAGEAPAAEEAAAGPTGPPMTSPATAPPASEPAPAFVPLLPGTGGPSSPPPPPTSTPGPASPTPAAPTEPPSTAAVDPTHPPSVRPSLLPSAIPSGARTASPSASRSPTYLPTSSSRPTVSPSYPPSLGPTDTQLPSHAPSASQMPSFPPSHPPSFSPIIAPSAAPSLEEERRHGREYIQRLTVSVPQSFDLEQVAIFQFLYQQYTEQFGYQVGEPHIVTECVVLSQQIGINSVRGTKGTLFRRGMHYGMMIWGKAEEEYDEDDRRLEERLNRRRHSTAWTDFWKRDKYGGHRERRAQTASADGYPLTMRFTVEYSTKVGIYDIEDYNTLFAEFVNTDLQKVVDDLALLGLPVASAGDVLMLKDRSPTLRPASDPPTAPPHTDRPTARPAPPLPTDRPTTVPSDMPTEDPPLIDVDVTDNSFVLGLSLGLTGAFLVAVGGMMYHRRAEGRDAAANERRRKRTERRGAGGTTTCGVTAPPGGSRDGGEGGSGTVQLTPNEDVEVGTEDRPLSGDALGDAALARDDGEEGHGNVAHAGGTGRQCQEQRDENGNARVPTAEPVNFGGEASIAPTHSSSPDNSMGYSNMFALPYPSQDSLSPPRPNGQFSVPQSAQSAADLHLFHPAAGQRGMAVHDASFSSGSSHHNMFDDDDDRDEPLDPSRLDGSTDELDNYKNQDLEALRTEIEAAVDGAEGMLGLAVTRALTDPEGNGADGLPWSGARDDGVVEASCLWEAYDWLKRNEHCGDDAIGEYYQDVLNRIVIAVMFGMASPRRGAHLAHACATILGLDLLKKLPQTTLVISGMRKTNDLARGHNFILKAFQPFGRVEEAAIAPGNRGFGFVRFVKPESVARALKKYREYEIEIQDVSVSIKALKSERTR